MSHTFRALQNPNYRLFAMGSLISGTGIWMQRVAQDWLVLQLDHDSSADASMALGITVGLQFLPILLFSPYAGLLADRMPKRRLLQISHAVMGMATLALGALALTGVLDIWMVYVVAVTFGVGAAFDVPARHAFVMELVGPDDVANAVSLNSASFNLARVFGPAIGGLLIAALGSGIDGTGLVMILNSLCFVGVILTIQRIDEATLNLTERAPRAPGMIREGVRYVRERPELKMILLVVFVVGIFGMNYQVAYALIATQVFERGAGELGLLSAAAAGGVFIGALAGARREKRPHPRFVLTAGVAFCLVVILLGMMPTFWAFAACAPLFGFCLITVNNSANTTVQLATTGAVRGRVLALYSMVLFGGTPVGAPLIGWVGAEFGARWAFVAGGVASLVGVLLIGYRYGGLRRDSGAK